MGLDSEFFIQDVGGYWRLLAVIGGLVILSIMALFVIGFSAFSDVRELVAEAEGRGPVR